MSTLIVVAYPDINTARLARAKLEQLQQQQVIQIEDAVIAHHEGDKIKLDQAVSLTGAGAAGGALWGGLFGLIFFVPIAGMAIGAATGALAGKFSDFGVDDNFAKQLGAKVTPGKAALVLKVGAVTTDKVIAEMAKENFGGELIQTSLSEADEEKLKAAVASAQAEPGGSAATAPPA